MSRTFTFSAALFASTLAACGGADRGRPGGGSAADNVVLDPCTADDGYEIRNFVDFEGEARPQGMDTEPRTTATCDPSVCMPSAFFFNYDRLHSNPDPNEMGRCPEDPPDSSLPDQIFGCDCQVAVNPDVFPETDPAVSSNLFGRALDEARCGSLGYALNVRARNIAMCYGSTGRLGWGGGIDITLAVSGPNDPGNSSGGGGGAGGSDENPFPPGTEGYDARAWDGLSFWVKKTPGPTKGTLIVTISDPGTTPPDPGAPGCKTEETAPDAEKCDSFGIAITLSEEWTFVPALFLSMRQKGFGYPSPLGRLDSGNLVKIQFLMGPGDWDFWLDDLGFFRAPR